MYHSLSESAEEGVGPYFKTSTRPDVFRRHMKYLAEEGYKALLLSEVLAIVQGRGAFPEKPVAITFDDGFKDFYLHGFPALMEYGLAATMFLPTAFIHDDGRPFKNKECLTWPEIREMKKAGMDFGSHTVNHPELRRLPFAEIERELAESKQRIEEELDAPAPFFSYPYAFPQENKVFAQEFRELLVQTGYACCVTTELGRVQAGDDPYRLKRLPANSLDDPSFFQAKLEGGYDWLAKPQALIKKIKHQTRPPTLLLANPLW
jgi:peptidoglycan/xylan/chitin deacetylase (PgdA/CDA1 family)